MMIKVDRKSCFIFTGLLSLFCVGNAWGLKIEPGVGVGVEYTGNAALAETNQQADTIVGSYVGASISHDTGKTSAKMNVSYNKHNYLKDTFEDQRYLKTDITANWAMVPQRFNWFLRDQFFQRPIVSTNSITPDNLQDSNIFSLSAQWALSGTGLSRFALIPEVKRYYYEVQNTDNSQFSLTGSWNYPMFRLTDIGTSISVRTIDYEQERISDVTFSSFNFTFNGFRARSTFDLSLGATNVKRKGSESLTGFSGSLLWLADLTRLSKVRLSVSSDLTDTNSGNTSSAIDSDTGEIIAIQVTTDVIRNKNFSVSYLRDSDFIKSKVWLNLREVIYSDSPNDRKISMTGVELSRPLTSLLTASVYSKYLKTNLIQQRRTDKLFSAGIRLRYLHTKKLKSSIDVRYADKESSRQTRSYEDTAIYYELVYGFGNVYRRSRSSG